MWHRRLLNSHINLNVAGNEIGDGDDLDVPLGLNMLEFQPRPLWNEDIANAEYIRNNLIRHLQRAKLYRELGETVLDIRWISTQGVTEGVFRLKNDFDILQRAVEEKYVNARILEPALTCGMALVKMVSEALVSQLFG